MLSKRVVLLAVALSFLFFTAPLAVHAQAVSTGTVTGTVTDPSGAVIVGAEVTLTDLSTKAERKLATNADGRYFIAQVPPGTYDLTIGKTGFKTAKISKQVVTVGLTLTLNAKLQIGAAQQVMEVKAGTGAELQTMNSTVNTSFSGVAIDSLPAIGRDVATFVTLQPGVSPDGGVAGAVFDQNTYQLDGGQNTNDMDGGFNYYSLEQGNDLSNGMAANCSLSCYSGVPSGVMPTPIDSIEEFKVSTTQQTADFNSSAGAQVSIVTRRGHDAWHGTAYEYYLNNRWNGNTFANNSTTPTSPIPKYHYSRFGGAVGGPIIPKKILGGKTYFFANYEGFRWPNSRTMLFNVPGQGMRQGLLDFNGTVYNLNPTATTYTGPNVGDLVSGTVYPSATAQAACGGVSCDPRGLGVSPTMQALWALMPQANFGSTGAGNSDGVNIPGFIGNVSLPTRTDFAVARIDHDFGDKEHFFASWRYYKLTRATTNQVQVSPAGKITSLSNRPQVPWFYAAGLTSNITSNFTNDFHYSYLRNWWQWGDFGAPPQLPGLGAALEPGGDGSSNTGVIPNLLPYNVNNQDIRQRYWDGQDHMIRDDMTRLIGNHVLQWGGSFQHNYNQHSRNDNGVSTNAYPTYVLATGPTSTDNGLNMAGFIPAGVGAGSFWANDYAMTLGLLSLDQFVASRSGPQLTLNPPLTPVTDRVRILYYNTYFTDSWHLKPTVTLTYGLAWTVEMPPVEENGLQDILVNQQNQPISTQDYLNSRRNAALLGNVYNPEIGYALVSNAAGGMKYPFQPYYGQFSPRAALAWSPNYDSGFLGSVFGRDKTVIRGGFAMIYGRINGVNLVLVPLLGYGVLQPVQCFGPTMAGACAGVDAATPANGFRIGPTATGRDGLVAPLATPSTTLPQPAFPGLPANLALPATGVQTLDSTYRPNKSYEFNFTIQRQIARNFTVEAGYIGRVLRNEYQQVDLNAVPYMFTLGRQQFQQAYANTVLAYCGGIKGLAGGGCARNAAAVTPQPFFETALGGAASPYCTGFASCTAAVVANEGSATGNLSTQNVWALWSDLDAGPFLAANGGALSGPTMLQNSGQLAAGNDGIGTITSLGYGNFHSLFISSRMSDWHGLTMQSNFTYGKALGTGAISQPNGGGTTADPFWIGREYGPQPADRKFVFNTFLVYQPPYYKSQRGVVGHLLGGWTFAPILVAGSGNPLGIFTTSTSAEFGASNATSFFANNQAVPIAGCSGYQSTTSRHNGVPGSNGIGTSGAFAINLFANPAAEFNCFRNPVLGFDNGDNGNFGNTLRGLAYWNVDMQIRKTTFITERVSAEFQVVFANLFNHNQFYDPSLNFTINTLSNPSSFGALSTPASSFSGNPRQFEFGIRLRF